jgi:isochorismate hydrolase
LPGIPEIESYLLPEPGQMPPSAVAWPGDAGRVALLVHDMQRYFVRPMENCPFYPTLVGNIARLIERFRATGLPIFYTGQPGSMTPAQRGLLADFWGPGMVADEVDCGFVDGITPQPEDTVLTKWRYSAFHASPLPDLLRAMGRSQLVVVGIYAHVGVLATCIDALSHGIQPLLPGDAVADFSLADHHMALEYAGKRCARVTSTSRLLKELSGRELVGAVT